MTVDDTKQPDRQLSPAADPESVSGFVARVLNQLSISAWLPGAFLIASLISLGWFWKSGEVSFSGIGSFIQVNWIPVLILALPALVIATLLTQAFSFEAIRALEGYWGHHGPASVLRSLGIRYQLARQRGLKMRQRKTLVTAFQRTKSRLSERRVDGLVLLAIENDLALVPRPPDLTENQHEEADELQLQWVKYCEPWDNAKLTRFELELKEFPEHSRIMPTKLGNILRTTEDRLRNTNGDLEGFVMAHRGVASARVLEHHDQFRTRLDMYCMLVFVAATAALVSLPLLWGMPILGQIAVPLALVAVSWASYRAALSSARGYVTTLRQIDAAALAALGSKTS
ncbi:hypothetical protein [Agromyces sp. NPDC049794]|uniref:hypothetical protein n=1 Tax=unclassified Agromyces TaxID=2639701 RepID=UPI00340A2F80